MSKKINHTHSAPGQALGYVFQLERALYWLSTLGAEASVSIETDDDVVASLNTGKKIEKIYEQDKSALSSRNPFSNQSTDLWKSLSIWAEGIKQGKFILGKCKFFLVTNKKIPNTCLIHQLTRQNNSKNFDDNLKAILAISAKPTGKLKTFCSKINLLSKNEIRALFKSLEVLDLNYLVDRDDYKTTIVKNLKISKIIAVNQVYSDLLGWLTDIVVDRWSKRQEATIKVEDFITKANEITAKYFNRPFIELAEAFLPVTDKQREENYGENFVRQLEWIKLEEEQILDCIDDYLRAKWERVRFAEEGAIPSISHYNEFEKELKAKWQSQFEYHSVDADKAEKKLANGKRIFWSLINQRVKLAGYETDQRYTTNGGYHRLANKFEIGWHIDWKKLKEKKS